MPSLATRQPATIATLVEPRQRRRLDAAAAGGFAALHAETVAEVRRTVRERPVRAILVSPRCVGREHLPQVAELVRGFPGVPTVAVVSEHDALASERLLELGAHGVERVLDLSARTGWERLRALVIHPATPLGARILAVVIPAMGEPSPDCRRLFEFLIRIAPGVGSVRTVARELQIPASTFMSRFFRWGLPSPKRYLAALRLVYAAGLLEAPGLSVADVAYRLAFSSPQSFGRHLRTVLGVTATEFRGRYPFGVAVRDFTSRLIIPFRYAFRTFHPLDNGVRDFVQGW